MSIFKRKDDGSIQKDRTNKDKANLFYSQSSEPSIKVAGTRWYDTTNKILKVYDGSAWKLSSEIGDKFAVVKTFTSAGINAAIDALGAEGGEVYLPEGDYDVTASVVIDYANTKLRGSGKATRLLATNRAEFDAVGDEAKDLSAGMTIKGQNNDYTATLLKVTYLTATTGIIWYHSLSNAANFENNEVIQDNADATYTITLTDTVTEQNFHVIDTNAKNYVTISDLCIYGGSGGGNANYLIGKEDAADYLTVEKCWLYESDSVGIAIGGDYSLIINNYFNGTESSGVFFASTDGDYSIVSNNILYNCGYGVEYQAGCPNIICINNQIYNPTTDGIYAFTINGRIENNYVESSGNYGIYVGGNYDYNIVTGNIIKTASNNAIHCSQTDYTLISNNIIEDTVSGYKDVYVVASDYCIISDNNCKGSGSSDYGIYLDESDYCVVSGNRTSGHDVVGIQEDSDCQNNLIYGNNCQDSTPYDLNGTSPETFNINGNLRTNVSEWWYCHHMDVINLATGGSGATQTVPTSDTLGGYKLDGDTEYLYLGAKICNNWDEESDIEVKVVFEVNIDNTGGNDPDTVDFDLLCYYKGDGETATKTQTPTSSVTVGKSAQYKQFTATILIDHDKVDNLVELLDVIAMRLNLNTDNSEVDNVIINNVKIRYKSKMPQPEI